MRFDPFDFPDVIEGGVRLVVVDGAGKVVKERFYGKTYLKRYLDADISNTDKNNIRHFWSEHPFFKAFGGNP